MPPAVLTGLQQAPAASATTAANSSAAPRPFKSTTDPVAVAKKRAAVLEADRKHKKEAQMTLKRVTEDMPQASGGDVHIAPSTGTTSHAPHCCGKLPQECRCQQVPFLQPQQQPTAEQLIQEAQDAALTSQATVHREQAHGGTSTPGTTDHQNDPEVDGNIQAAANSTINLDDEDDDLQGGVSGKEAETGLIDAPDAQVLPFFREASPAQ